MKPIKRRKLDYLGTLLKKAAQSDSFPDEWYGGQKHRHIYEVLSSLSDGNDIPADPLICVRNEFQLSDLKEQVRDIKGDERVAVLTRTIEQLLKQNNLNSSLQS